MMDTNTVSHIVRGRSPRARATLASLAPDQVACISSITEGEVMFGLAKTPAARALRSAVTDLFAKLQILPWGSAEAAAYGSLRARLEARGKSLTGLDMLIAAHAVAAGAALVTSDKAFRQVTELRSVIDWATDLKNRT